jgi:hypothetical protein
MTIASRDQEMLILQEPDRVFGNRCRRPVLPVPRFR